MKMEEDSNGKVKEERGSEEKQSLNKLNIEKHKKIKK